MYAFGHWPMRDRYDRFNRMNRREMRARRIFYFKDDEGNIFYGNKQNAVAKPNFLKGNDLIHIQIPYTPQKYYLEKEGSTVVEGELTEPYFLPKGKYTVGAMAPLTDLNPLKEETSFEDENSFEENVGIDLKAEIIIEIK